MQSLAGYSVYKISVFFFSEYDEIMYSENKYNSLISMVKVPHLLADGNYDRHIITYSNEMTERR